MVLRVPGIRPRRVAHFPPPNHYREFDVDPGAITTSGYARSRRGLSAPESYYRMTSLAVRNLSAVRLTVTLPGRPEIPVPPGTTDIINGGNSFVDEYKVVPSANTAANEVFLVERCRSWAGWTLHRQDV